MIACYRRPCIVAVVQSPDHNPQCGPLYLVHLSGDSGLGDQNHQGYWSPGLNSLANQNHGDRRTPHAELVMYRMSGFKCDVKRLRFSK